MPHDIIDNRNTLLNAELNALLANSQRARFATGYFFISGLEAVAGSLANLEELRLLIGSVSEQKTVDQIAEGLRRQQEMAEELEAQRYPGKDNQKTMLTLTAVEMGRDASAMPQNTEAEQMVRVLADLVAQNRVKVKVYTRGRLHAKAYIFDYCPHFDAQGRLLPLTEPGSAIVGSSNFTLAGLTHNSELNVKIHGAANHEELVNWFDRLWLEAQDFQPQFLEELKQSWAMAEVTPYEVYLKALYEFVHDRLDDPEQGEFLWQSEITAKLTDFQKNAVRRAVQIIRQYNGGFISDVVGLGKSYVGAAIVKHFERWERTRTLIICPKSLEKMWEHYNTRYQLNALILPMSMLKKDKDHPEYNILMDTEKYRDCDFVLVDESHNYRSPETQRYHLLQEYLQAGDRLCVFLTATPRNKDILDIYHQIKLYHSGDATRIPIDPPNLRTYIQKVKDGERKSATLLSNIMVRRTRMDVLRWYGYDSVTHERVNPFHFDPYRKGEKRAYILVDGKPQFFPKRRLQTITYNIDAVYSGLYDELLGIISRPGGKADPQRQLNYSRYGLWNYVRPEMRNKTPYNELQRAGINLRGLMRITLFKRLDSSVEAFRTSISRMIARSEQFINAMDLGIIPAGEEASDIMVGNKLVDPEDYEEALAEASKKYQADDFDVEHLRKDILHDRALLRKMREMTEPITPDDDDKLQELKHWLLQGRNGFRPLANRKCLIFTQYEDTARYVAENLRDILPGNMEMIAGNSKDKMLTAFRFAPRANDSYEPSFAWNEIDVLVATDVMSEGLNLQDCSQIVNYDLHWNPVRLIQRFGRIDRIGTKHEEIFGFNFLPEPELDKGLKLVEKLRKRIKEINEMLAADGKLLTEDEQFNQEAFQVIYQGQGIDQYEYEDDEELVDLTEAEEFMRQLRQNDPELFKKITGLRDGIRSARQGDKRNTFVVCRAGDYRQVYQVDPTGSSQAGDIAAVLGQMKCEPDTPRTMLPERYNETICTIQEQFENEVKAWKASQRTAVTLTRAQKYVTQELQKLYAQVENEDQKAQIELLEKAFRGPITRIVNTELNGIHKAKVSDLALFELLDKIYLRHGMAQRNERMEQEKVREEVPIVVCSIGEG